MPSWLVFLYLLGTSWGLRGLFWLIGRWFGPGAPQPVARDAAVPQPVSEMPLRPPLGDYRG